MRISRKNILQWIKSLCVAPQESTSNERAYGVFQKDGKFSKAKLCLLHSIQIFKGQKEARSGKMAQCSDPYYTGLWAWVSILSFHAKP